MQFSREANSLWNRSNNLFELSLSTGRVRSLKGSALALKTFNKRLNNAQMMREGNPFHSTLRLLGQDFIDDALAGRNSNA